MVISSKRGTITAIESPYIGPKRSELKIISESLTSSVKNPIGIFIKYIQAYANAQNIAVAVIFLILISESFLVYIKKSPFCLHGRISNNKKFLLLLFSSGLSDIISLIPLPSVRDSHPIGFPLSESSQTVAAFFMPLHCRYGISPIPKEKYVLFFEMRGETAKASPRKNQVTEN